LGVWRCCLQIFPTKRRRKEACSVPRAFGDAHKPKVGRHRDTACGVAQGEQAPHGQPEERFLFLSPHLTEALETADRILSA